MNHQSKKNSFSSSLGFMAATAGSSVGLYNMWKFPYEAGNAGGGCFVLVYLICAVVVGYPLLMAELSLGRYSGENVYRTYGKVGKGVWRVVGGVCVGMAFLLLSFYQVVSGQILGYAYESVFGGLLDDATVFSTFLDDYVKNVPKNVGSVLLIDVLAMLIIRRGIREGIERCTKVLMPLFVVILLGMIGYGLLLENAMAGVYFFLRPDFSKFSISLFYAALEQCLSSIGIGIGVLVTYGGYLRKKDNVANAGMVIVLGDTLVSLLAGLLIFPLLFHQGLAPAEGPSLIFVSLPIVFRSLGGILGRLLGMVYFLLLSLATITSSIAVLETVVKYVVEEWKVGRKQGVNGVILVVFLLNMGCLLSFGGSVFFTHFVRYGGHSYSFFDVMTSLFGAILPLMCLGLSMLVVLRWRTSAFLIEVNDKRKWLNVYLKVMVGYVAPIVIGLVMLAKLVL